MGRGDNFQLLLLQKLAAFKLCLKIHKTLKCFYFLKCILSHQIQEYFSNKENKVCLAAFYKSFRVRKVNSECSNTRTILFNHFCTLKPSRFLWDFPYKQVFFHFCDYFLLPLGKIPLNALTIYGQRASLVGQLYLLTFLINQSYPGNIY